MEAAVLGVLQTGSLHGYRISQEIRARSGGLLKSGDNQIYPTLHALELEGRISAEWQPQQGKPPRKVYSITGSGRQRLAHLHEEWKAYSSQLSRLIGIEAFAC